MLRGHFKISATSTLAAILIASPVLAATPGAASRRATKRAAARESQPQQSEQPQVRNAVGLLRPDGSDRIQQVVGKQPGSREVNPNRSLSLMPRLLGGQGRQASVSGNNRAGRAAPQANGILNDLFGGGSSQPENRSTASRAADPSRPDVNWDGIPYHRAESKPRSTAPTPIRDPQPGETRISNQPSVARTTSSRRQSSMNRAAPEPPQLAPAPKQQVASSRRRQTAESSAKSNSYSLTDSAQLSRLSSSRRSGRRDVPGLDASEIAAAKAKSLPENDLVPKFSRRQIKSNPESVAKASPAAERAAEETKSPSNISSRRTTPAADVASSTKSKPQPSPAPSVAKLSDQVAEMKPAREEPDADAKPEVETSTAENAPGAESLATTSKPESQAKPETQAEPKADLDSETPTAEDSDPAIADSQAPAAPLAEAVADAESVTPQLPPNSAAATPRPAAIPESPITMPTYRSSELPGRVAGYHAGPPATAFTPRSQPLPSADIVGSGVAASPQYAPRIATNPSPAGDQPAIPYGTSPDPAAATAPQPQTMHLPAPTNNSPGPQLGPTAANTPTLATNGEPISSPKAGGRVGSKADFRSANTLPAMRPADRSGNTTNNGQTATTSELPGLRVVTHGPSSVIIRQNHEFEIHVENRGSIDAKGLTVRTRIPAWAEVRGQTQSEGHVKTQVIDGTEHLVWAVDSLPAGTSERMLIRLRALQSGSHKLSVDWTLVPQKTFAQVEVREPKLDLLIEGPDEVVYGQSQTYRVRVLNPGDGVAPNVVFTLSPNSSTPQTQRIGNIPSGKEAQFEVELTAQDLGDLKIHGLASGDLNLKAEADKTIRVAAAELEAVLAGPEIKYQNSEATYFLQLTNNGSATCKNVATQLRLPVGARYAGGIDSARQQGDRLTWQIDALPPGATREYEFRCLMNSPGQQRFEFSAQGSAAGQATVSLDTQVDSIADLVMTIQDPAAPAPVGKEVSYEILIKNRGSRAADDVRAIAQFSHGIEPNRIEGVTGQVMTGQVMFDPIESIGPGEEVRVKVIAVAETGGHHRFRTEIRSGETVLVAEEATHYMSKRSERVSRRSTSSSQR
jgi:hypothetical protein